MLLLAAIISYSALDSYRWHGNSWKETVRSDGSGYYAYLPAVFIYQDLEYNFYRDLKDKYAFGDLSANFLIHSEGRKFNRYYCGTAIAMTPFFLSAMAASSVIGFDVDGHSILFNYALNIGAIFYAFLGLYFLYRFLIRHFSKWIVAIACGAIFLGTNLFYYTVYESSYSHSFSFSFICFFIYLADVSIRTKTRKSFVLLAAIAGMVFLIRPSNAIVLLSLPFIAGSKEAFIGWLKSAFKISIFVPTVVVGLAVASIQFWLNYLQCGSFIVDGYPTETFYFTRPELVNMWFSYRAGVLVWSPVVILSLVGLIALFQKNKFLLLSFLGFMFINSWIISSWWAWHYSGTFGMRPMVDYMAFFVILLCYALSLSNSISWRILSLTTLLALTFIGHTMNIQKIREIVHYDKMTKEKFWYIFMHNHQKYSYLLSEPYRPPSPKPYDKIRVKHFSFKAPKGFDNFPEGYSNFNSANEIEYSGTGDAVLARIDPGNMQGTEKYYFELQAKTYYLSLNDEAKLIVQFKSGDQVLHTSEFLPLQPDFRTKHWNIIQFSLVAEESMKEADEIVLSIRNKDKQIFFQQLEITLANFK